MKMLFILGYRRSATTALAEQVQTHPSVQYLDGGIRLSGIARLEFHLFDLIDRSPAQYAELIRQHSGSPPSGDPTADAEAIFARCTRPVGLVKSTRLLMSAAAWRRFKAWAAVTTHEVWLLGITRFPLDALSSDIKNFASRAIPDERVRQLETAQEVWSEAYGRLLDDTAFATAAKLLRVEDVIDRPYEQIQGVAEWLGIAPFGQFIPWRPTNAGRWRTDPAFAGFAPRPATREIARRLGYEL